MDDQRRPGAEGVRPTRRAAAKAAGSCPASSSRIDAPVSGGSAPTTLSDTPRLRSFDATAAAGSADTSSRAAGSGTVFPRGVGHQPIEQLAGHGFHIVAADDRELVQQVEAAASIALHHLDPFQAGFRAAVHQRDKGAAVRFRVRARD